MSEKLFLTRLFLLTLLGLLLIYSFIAIIDPHKQFGLNIYNSCFSPNERTQKSILIENNKYNYDIFVLGSSRSDNFDLSLISDLTSERPFLYNIPGASINDYVSIISQISQNQRAKTIYLQLDFFIFDTLYGDTKIQAIMGSPLGKYYLDPYIDDDGARPGRLLFFEKSYFSLLALVHAVKASGKCKSIPKNPMKKKGETDSESDNKDIVLAHDYFKAYDTFELNEVRLKKRLMIIKKISEANSINLIVGFSPMNLEHITRLGRDQGLVKKWFQAKKLVGEVFGSFYDFNTCEVESYAGSLYWGDSVHSKKILTQIMINKIFSKNRGQIKAFPFGRHVQASELNQYLQISNFPCITKR